MTTDGVDEYDVIVAGAGHNGLVSAAYLAKAGMRVLLLEDQEVVGGNARTEEHIPGYFFDSGASGHALIQATPILREDELGLLANGLRYEFPELVEVALLPDGSTLPVYIDIDETAKEIARISPADADAYRRFEEEARSVAAIAGLVERSPIGTVDVPDDIRRKLSRRAWDVISQRFVDPRIQTFLNFEASIVLVPPDQSWTARYVYISYFARHTPNVSWGTAIGGSGALTDALRAAFERFGGITRTGHRVTRILIEDGSARGVECAGGEQFRASRGVVSSIHVKHLVDMVPRSMWPEEFVDAVNDIVTGPSVAASFIATTEPPRYRDARDGRELVPMGATVPGTLQDSLGWGLRDMLGQPSFDTGMMLLHTGTVLDPTRAPAGGHTVKAVSFQPYNVGGDPDAWDGLRDRLEEYHLRTLQRYAPNITPEKILGVVTRTPKDLVQWNIHNIGGSVHGGELLASQMWDTRPAPGWANHRLPVSGLYQTGATTHPGGGITGVSGRNAAAVLLEDLGIDLETAISSR